MSTLNWAFFFPPFVGPLHWWWSACYISCGFLHSSVTLIDFLPPGFVYLVGHGGEKSVARSVTFPGCDLDVSDIPQHGFMCSTLGLHGECDVLIVFCSSHKHTNMTIMDVHVCWWEQFIEAFKVVARVPHCCWGFLTSVKLDKLAFKMFFTYL